MATPSKSKLSFNDFIKAKGGLFNPSGNPIPKPSVSFTEKSAKSEKNLSTTKKSKS